MAESLCPIYPEKFQLCIKHLYVLRLEVWRSAFQKCVRHVTCSLSEQACLGRSRLQDNKEESTFFHWLWKMICLHCLWRAKVSKRGLRISCKNRPCKKREKKNCTIKSIDIIDCTRCTNKQMPESVDLWGQIIQDYGELLFFPLELSTLRRGKMLQVPLNPIYNILSTRKTSNLILKLDYDQFLRICGRDKFRTTGSIYPIDESFEAFQGSHLTYSNILI